MKKEELIALGISEDIAKQIMSINGADIENAKTKEQAKAEKTFQELENIKSKLEEKDQLINDANSQIEKFKGMDVESKDKAIQEWQEKYKLKEEEFKVKETEYQQKLQQQQYNFKIDEVVREHKFVDKFVEDAFKETLRKQEFKIGEDGTLQGVNDYINKMKEEHKGIFVVEEAPKPNNEPQIQQFAASTNNGVPTKGISLMDAMKAANSNQAVDIGQVGRFANQ